MEVEYLDGNDYPYPTATAKRYEKITSHKTVFISHRDIPADQINNWIEITTSQNIKDIAKRVDIYHKTATVGGRHKVYMYKDPKLMVKLYNDEYSTPKIQNPNFFKPTTFKSSKITTPSSSVQTAPVPKSFADSWKSCLTCIHYNQPLSECHHGPQRIMIRLPYYCSFYDSEQETCKCHHQ
jgi:hypothetical protein